MRKYYFIILATLLTIYMVGCGKKQQSLKELQEPMSIEDLSRLTAQTQAPVSESKPPESQAPQAQSQLASLPPAGPYKPTAQEIQTALKNAGFYTAAIDGKIGPITKKAIEDFQRANGLKVDAKVGPQTWQVLSNHLNPPAESQAKKR